MASEDVSREYLEDAADVVAELEENGFIASFGNDGERDQDRNPTGYIEVCQEPVFEIDGKDIFKDIAKTDDSFFMVGNKSNKLDECSIMKTNSGTRKIFKKEPFMPDGVNVIFTWVLVRE